MFADKVRIFVKAGNGGNGAVSFHTEKYVPNGGPDGGDGGKGGDVIFVASSSINTLSEFYYKKHYRAQNGENGAGQNCYGKQGQDLKISVPVGTVVRDKETGRIMADMFENGQTFVVMRGGEGGRGNRKFATSRRQAPAFSQHGVKTEEKEIELELKTIADVGLVGFPNVGKKHAFVRYFRRASQDCKLSFYDAQSQSRSGRRFRGQLCRGGYSRSDRGRGQRRGAGTRVFAAH